MPAPIHVHAEATLPAIKMPLHHNSSLQFCFVCWADKRIVRRDLCGFWGAKA